MEKIKIYFLKKWAIILLTYPYDFLLAIPYLALPVLFANIFIIDTAYIWYLVLDVILVLLVSLYRHFLEFEIFAYLAEKTYKIREEVESSRRLALLINTEELEKQELWEKRVLFLGTNVLQGIVFYVFIIALGIYWHSINYGEYMEYVAIAFIYGIIPPIIIFAKLGKFKKSLELQSDFTFDIIIAVITIIILSGFLYLGIHFFK